VSYAHTLLGYCMCPRVAGLLPFVAALALIFYGTCGSALSAKRRAVKVELARRAARRLAQRKLVRFHAASAGIDWAGVVLWAEENPIQCHAATPYAVLQLSATALVDLIRADRLSCEYVMRCYAGRALVAGASLGCNAFEMFGAALEEARACDKERASGRLRGPLHGLPISVKDQFDMMGVDSTMGLACRIDAPAARDAVLVQLCRAAGAIPFVRTTVPQLLMAPETFSFFGVTSNPWDKSRTPGGSSGGEGALIAARGSPLGLGTDIGGSIRIPTAFCGVCGFKPTNDRLSSVGIGVPRLDRANGMTAVRASPGPMASTVNDLELLMRVWCSNGTAESPTGAQRTMYDLDPSLPCVPWDSDAFVRATGLSHHAARTGDLSIRFCLSIYLFNLSIYLYICPSIYLSLSLSTPRAQVIHLSVSLSIYLSVQSIYLSIQSCYLSVSLSIIYLSLSSSTPCAQVIHLSVSLSIYLSIQSIYLYICPSIDLSLSLSTPRAQVMHLSASLSIYLSIQSMYLSVYLSIYLFIFIVIHAARTGDLSICICLSIYLFNLSIYLFNLSIYLYLCPSIYLSLSLSTPCAQVIYLSVSLSI